MQSDADAVEAAEERFHDEWAESVDVNSVRVDELFESGACPENRQILEWMGDIEGKRLLDVGCGLGESSVYFAKRGARVTATDLSSAMLNVTSRLAARHGVNVETVKVSANSLANVPDHCFDIVYAANLLHHVDIDAFLTEVKKKVKPGGSLYFWDPIHYNPVIQIYRRMATAVRTEDEHPLKRSDLELIRRHFSSCETRYFWYLALVIFLKFYLIDRLHPNQARYWKKIVEDADRIGPFLNVMHAVDRALFSWLPGMKWLGWNIAIHARV